MFYNRDKVFFQTSFLSTTEIIFNLADSLLRRKKNEVSPTHYQTKVES